MLPVLLLLGIGILFLAGAFIVNRRAQDELVPAHAVVELFVGIALFFALAAVFTASVEAGIAVLLILVFGTVAHKGHHSRFPVRN